MEIFDTKDNGKMMNQSVNSKQLTIDGGKKEEENERWNEANEAVVGFGCHMTKEWVPRKYGRHESNQLAG